MIFGASEASRIWVQGLAPGKILATMPFKSLESDLVAKNLPLKSSHVAVD